jgi:LysR family transcriptional activator of nhaA
MRHLNYSHLLYFWTVAREGSVARASEVLHLTPQTVSGQIRTLEQSIGEELFIRDGRRLVLSEMGKMIFEYAEDIFSVGAELAEVVKSRRPRGPITFTVGVTDVVPKLIAARVLEPALALDEPVRIICVEGKLEALLADLAVHRLDMVLADRRAPEGLSIRVFSHPLGESGISFFASPSIIEKLEGEFPTNLHGSPMLLPTDNTALRRAIDLWFDDKGVVPNVRGEFEDSALIKAFGDGGFGVFPGPTVIEDSIVAQYRVHVIGRAPSIRESFYAISPQRRMKHPAAIAIREAARSELFGVGDVSR